MGVMQRVVWYVESNHRVPFDLADVARHVGVSRFHLSRLFGGWTGSSLMGYVRGRKLTEAARALTLTDISISEIAFDHGYASHEAFSRAFKEHFGIKPKDLRALGDLSQLQLVEPYQMSSIEKVALKDPRIEALDAFTVTGKLMRVRFEKLDVIPALWREFAPYFGQIPSQVGGVTYGVCANTDHNDGTFDYIAGAETKPGSEPGKELQSMKVPAQRYVIFTHSGHVGDISSTWNAILDDWLPESEHEASDGPSFERYDERFDGETGRGDVEIWIPVK